MYISNTYLHNMYLFHINTSLYIMCVRYIFLYNIRIVCTFCLYSYVHIVFHGSYNKSNLRENFEQQFRKTNKMDTLHLYIPTLYRKYCSLFTDRMDIYACFFPSRYLYTFIKHYDGVLVCAFSCTILYQIRKWKRLPRIYC